MGPATCVDGLDASASDSPHPAEGEERVVGPRQARSLVGGEHDHVRRRQRQHDGGRAPAPGRAGARTAGAGSCGRGTPTRRVPAERCWPPPQLSVGLGRDEQFAAHDRFPAARTTAPPAPPSETSCCRERPSVRRGAGASRRRHVVTSSSVRRGPRPGPARPTAAPPDGSSPTALPSRRGVEVRTGRSRRRRRCMPGPWSTVTLSWRSLFGAEAAVVWSGPADVCTVRRSASRPDEGPGRSRSAGRRRCGPAGGGGRRGDVPSAPGAADGCRPGAGDQRHSGDHDAVHRRWRPGQRGSRGDPVGPRRVVVANDPTACAGAVVSRGGGHRGRSRCVRPGLVAGLAGWRVLLLAITPLVLLATSWWGEHPATVSEPPRTTPERSTLPGRGVPGPGARIERDRSAGGAVACGVADPPRPGAADGRHGAADHDHDRRRTSSPLPATDRTSVPWCALGPAGARGPGGLRLRRLLRHGAGGAGARVGRGAHGGAVAGGGVPARPRWRAAVGEPVGVVLAVRPAVRRDGLPAVVGPLPGGRHVPAGPGAGRVEGVRRDAAGDVGGRDVGGL